MRNNARMGGSNTAVGFCARRSVHAKKFVGVDAVRGRKCDGKKNNNNNKYQTGERNNHIPYVIPYGFPVHTHDLRRFGNSVVFTRNVGSPPERGSACILGEQFYCVNKTKKVSSLLSFLFLITGFSLA